MKLFETHWGGELYVQKVKQTYCLVPCKVTQLINYVVTVYLWENVFMTSHNVDFVFDLLKSLLCSLWSMINLVNGAYFWFCFWNISLCVILFASSEAMYVSIGEVSIIASGGGCTLHFGFRRNWFEKATCCVWNHFLLCELMFAFIEFLYSNCASKLQEYLYGNTPNVWKVFSGKDIFIKFVWKIAVESPPCLRCQANNLYPKLRNTKLKTRHQLAFLLKKIIDSFPVCSWRPDLLAKISD